MIRKQLSAVALDSIAVAAIEPLQQKYLVDNVIDAIEKVLERPLKRHLAMSMFQVSSLGFSSWSTYTICGGLSDLTKAS